MHIHDHYYVQLKCPECEADFALPLELFSHDMRIVLPKDTDLEQFFRKLATNHGPGCSWIATWGGLKPLPSESEVSP